MQNDEKWHPIPFFEDYEACELGYIRNRQTGRVLKPRDNGFGRMIVTLRRRNRNNTRTVHGLIASTFLPPAPSDSSTPFHIDGDPRNNHVDNLEWRERWWVLQHTEQRNRVTPLDDRPVEMVINTKHGLQSTGEIFENALHAAQTLNVLEKGVLWAAEDPHSRITSGHKFRFFPKDEYERIYSTTP